MRFGKSRGPLDDGAEFGKENVYSLDYPDDLADPEQAAVICLDLMLASAVPDDPSRTVDNPSGRLDRPITRLQRNAFYFCVGPDSTVASTVEQDPELPDRIERALYRRLVELVMNSDVLQPWLRQEDPVRESGLRAEDPDQVEGWLRDHLALFIEIIFSPSYDQWKRNGLGWHSAGVVLCIHRWSVRPYFEQARRTNATLGVTPVYEVGVVHLSPPASGRVRLNLHTREHYDPSNLLILSNMAGCALSVGAHPANDVVVEPPGGAPSPRARIRFESLKVESDGENGVRVRGRIQVTPGRGVRVLQEEEATVQRLLATDHWPGTASPDTPAPPPDPEIARCILQSRAFWPYNPNYFRPYVRPRSRTLPRAGEYPQYGLVPPSDPWVALIADEFDTVVEILPQLALAARPRGEGAGHEVMLVVPAGYRELNVTLRGARVDQTRLSLSGLGAYPLETGTLLEIEKALRARWIAAATTGGVPVGHFHGELHFDDDRGQRDMDFTPPAVPNFAAADAAVLRATGVRDGYLSREPSNAAVHFGAQYGAASLVLPYDPRLWSRDRARPAHPTLFVRVGGAMKGWQAYHPDAQAAGVLRDSGHELLPFNGTMPGRVALPEQVFDRRFELIVGSTRYLVAPRNTP